MSEQYAREILRRNVAQICQTIGWDGINSTPYDVMAHILEKYIRTLGTQASRYAEQFNRTEPNLHDLGLVFRDLHVQLPELVEYTRSVPPVPSPVHIENFPKPKESYLNFLNPGSHEVVTRPTHVHEHLPPMYPEKERDTPAVAGTVEIRENGIDNVDTNNATSTSASTSTSPEISVTESPEKPIDLFKRPTDPVSLPNSKRQRLRLYEEERTREISSVMMTMSGFLLPAREGKLPEAQPPTIITEKNSEQHKTNSHHSNPAKAPVLEKSDKKFKNNKLLNGKIMKSKRKDNSHKGESSKSKDSSKSSKHPPEYLAKSKDHTANPLLPNVSPTPSNTAMPPPPASTVTEPARPVIKQGPLDPPLQVAKNLVPGEEAIPVPRKIPVSKSSLVSNPSPVNKFSPSSLILETENKQEITDEEEKLASQPDRSKINIFKRISNKSKEEKSSPEVVSEKVQSDSMISKVQNSTPDMSSETKTNENVRIKPEETVVNNNDTSAVDLSKEMNLRAHEVISIDDDSMDTYSHLQAKPEIVDHPSISVNKSLQLPYSKDVASVSPKIKKEKKHKDKKDKAAKLEAKLLKKQQQQLAYEMAQAEKPSPKPTKTSRPKNESKVPQMPPGFPFFPEMPSGRNLMPGPGLIPNPDLIPGSEFLAGLVNNPALRGLPSSSLLSNPFSLAAGGPGLIPGSSFLPGNLGAGIPNPNILQKHKSKSHKDHKSSTTIELNPPKLEPVRQEQPREPPIPIRSPTPEPVEPQLKPILASEPIDMPAPAQVPQEKVHEHPEKKKDKSHKKDKKDKDGITVKKKKVKKDKNKDKSEKKRVKEDKIEMKEIKEKKKKIKSGDVLVPKLILKLGSSNSNSPMPPSSPDVFKLNIKPVVKKEEEESSPMKDEPLSREHTRSPELAQISALVTRPPKRKHLKQNHITETETQSFSPPTESSPPRKNRRPSSHSKYKRILIKPLSKKEHFEDDMASMSDEPAASQPIPTTDKPIGPLPTPYYMDEHGNKIWVCPACGRPDNGSPMIGCDGCDGWYHFVCVGITEEPGASEDWFCKSCLAKHTAMVLTGVTTSGKKRGRKPKREKVRD
ncbi:transcription initiation factor TFIID subunit 3-like [Pectinophora gossypiella]|uniref:transcription initiation factor TFIID subunit 3-like n=1 Tax=Pectinophora gossypiella TaxID=13191 RepID=UPI00214F2DDC|nr:transcription initiation factor TFIID subunit 3-like [Pectinophora gossypiella]